MNMKKLLMVGIAALFLLIGGGSIFAEEYKLFYSGNWGGFITATRDTGGKITINFDQLTFPSENAVALGDGAYRQKTSDISVFGSYELTYHQCPLVPEGMRFEHLKDVKEIVIDGNTVTIIYKGALNGHREEWVVEGNTTTATSYIPPSGDAFSKVITVIEGNTTTATNYNASNGVRVSSEKWVVEGNITTKIDSIDRVFKQVVDGNVIYHIDNDAKYSFVEVIDKQGYNIYTYVANTAQLRERGSAYYTQKNYDQAIADYTQAIRLDPNNENAYYDRGRAYAAKSDYDRAISDYNQAIRIDPNDAYNYNARGNAYLNQKNYDMAIADYNQALRVDPNYTSANNNLANAYYNRGSDYYRGKDYTRAIADYEAALRFNPNYANAREWLGNARQARGY
ncbi:hypothetical protein AGMMS49579_06140 [Spirochaetia bacterium]|nr:hypothetical protein AGMMS49579_06140 [Spirochaetia bacterium]